MVAFLRLVFSILISVLADFAVGKAFSFGSGGAKPKTGSSLSKNVVLTSKTGVGGNVVDMMVVGSRAIPIPKISGLFNFLKSFFIKHKKLSKFTFGLLVFELFTKWPSEFLKDGISSVGEFFQNLGSDEFKNIQNETDINNLDNINGVVVTSNGVGTVIVNGYNVDLDGSGEVTYKEYRINKRVNELVMSLDQNFVELVRLAKQYDFDVIESINYFGR